MYDSSFRLALFILASTYSSSKINTPRQLDYVCRVVKTITLTSFLYILTILDSVLRLGDGCSCSNSTTNEEEENDLL